MVNTGLIIAVGSLVLLVVFIMFVKKFGVIRKKLPPLQVKRRLQASGDITNTQEFCVKNKCFRTKPEARRYAESIARRI